MNDSIYEGNTLYCLLCFNVCNLLVLGGMESIWNFCVVMFVAKVLEAVASNDFYTATGIATSSRMSILSCAGDNSVSMSIESKDLTYESLKVSSKTCR